MTLRDLVSGGRGRNVPAQRPDEGGHALLALHREINHMFDDFYRGFDLPTSHLGWSRNWPHLEVNENDDELKLVVELPGMEEKDIEVTLCQGVLTIRGEKKLESNDALYSDRWHGQFQRSMDLGPDVDAEKARAMFKNGVLTITLAKRPDAQRQAKRIPISKG